jgi:hypothetical protein
MVAKNLTTVVKKHENSWQGFIDNQNFGNQPNKHQDIRAVKNLGTNQSTHNVSSRVI